MCDGSKRNKTDLQKCREQNTPSPKQISLQRESDMNDSNHFEVCVNFAVGMNFSPKFTHFYLQIL